MSYLARPSLCIRSMLLLLFAVVYLTPRVSGADALSPTPILFVTAPPNPDDFGTMAATFGNHDPSPAATFRGGDLWIRYPDGTLKNLTAAAGFGNAGFQGAQAIAVRDPAVHWDGDKAIFSMLVGAPAKRYEPDQGRWQLYEIVGLGPAETPSITKVPRQPTGFNNLAPVYASDDSILFLSDRPRDDSVLHTYPQLDEYESAPTNSGLWKLNPVSGELQLLDHAPSGDFNPIVDSFGRVIFSRWDHLQRDQQNVGGSAGAFNFESEQSTRRSGGAAEFFPEPRSSADPDFRSTVNLHTLNQFFPWMINQDGTELETLNHIGRHEIGNYIERSFNNDENLEEFYGQYQTGVNQSSFEIFLHIKESPTEPGTYFGTNCQEFGTHSAGQLLALAGPPGENPDTMVVRAVTHPDTSSATDTPSAQHSGLYRNPLPLSHGGLIASHTSETRTDENSGSAGAPRSRHAFRLKRLVRSGEYFVPAEPLTGGISKTVSFWNPDQLVSYSGLMWELMPVEVRARPRPAATHAQLPAVEGEIFRQLGVDAEEFRHFLRERELALVVSRNVTMRDRNDRQQPFNLRIPGSATARTPREGRVYDISLFQIFQGDLVRGYSDFGEGRRVLAKPMHSVPALLNDLPPSGVTGAVTLGADGSMAAFVPARRALSWQLTGADGMPVVRERYWLTFQPGEIRVCASCHGINTADHLGDPAPNNPPEALGRLLARWKGIPYIAPPAEPRSGLWVRGPRRARARFVVQGLVAPGEGPTRLAFSVQGRRCGGTYPFAGSPSGRTISGRYPALSGARVGFFLQSLEQRVVASSEVRVQGVQLAQVSAPVHRAVCGRLMRSLRAR